MNVVKIDNKHAHYNEDNFNYMITECDDDFKVNNDTLALIETIHGDSCLIAYYIVYLIVSNNTLLPNINTPKNGLAFNSKIDSNKSNDITIGIYHAHLPDENVLIWYVARDEYNELILKVKCIKHPQSYDTILRDIMKTTDGYDIFRKQYLKDYLKDTYLKENKYILMFKDFFNFK